MLASKKHLNLKSLIVGFKQASLTEHQDTRRQNSTRYGVVDTALSVLACMFYQSSSLLRFQRLLEKRFYKSNLETQFGVHHIPSDNQMRTIMGSIPSEQFAPVFKNYLNRLQRGKQLKGFQFQEKYLAAIDATQHYQSEDIHCSDCLRRTKRNGKTEYSHKVLQPILCHPGQKQILPMMPEPIKNNDGNTKQDCEINAAKRLLPKLRAQHPRMPFIWLADSLYATAPFLQSIIDHDESFIVRVKKGDHKALYQHIDQASYHSHRSVMGNTQIAYRWYDEAPLNNSTDITVTVIKAFMITTDRTGHQTSTIAGVWATNLEVKAETVASITKAARARWRIENQCFNAVKNYGYNLSHNWGHVKGEAFNFYVMTILAFYLHQIFEMTDSLFQQCRKVCVTCQELWEELRARFKMMLFESWEAMLIHCIDGSSNDPPLCR